jgi:hypothetical protein
MTLTLYLSAQFSHFLLVFMQLCTAHTTVVKSIAMTCIRFEQVEHQFQTVPIQIHVQPVLAKHKHDSGCAKAKALKTNIIHLLLQSHLPEQTYAAKEEKGTCILSLSSNILHTTASTKTISQ